jgi:hypothetical protein
MASTKTDRVRELFRKAGFEAEAEYLNMDRVDSQMLYSLALEVDSAEENLERLLHQASADLERAAKQVAEGYHVNSLGILQSRGPAVDIAAAIREERHSNWRRTVAAVKKMREVEAGAKAE